MASSSLPPSREEEEGREEAPTRASICSPLPPSPSPDTSSSPLFDPEGGDNNGAKSSSA